jgi:LacI family transcriptional regulator
MVTIKEIAKSVGVSSATVSRVLNYDATLSISEAKRQAIIETAEALNYLTPRNRARAQRLLTDANVARIAILHFLRPEEELADPYYIGVRMGIEARARANRMEVVTVYDSDPDNEVANSDFCGVISLGMHTDEEIDRARQMSQSVVLADFSPSLNHQFDIVASDLRLAMMHLLQSLYEADYRRFAFIGDNRSSHNIRYPSNEERTQTFKQWLSDRDLFDPELYLIGDRLTYQNGYRLASQLLDKPDRPEIVIASNDNMAIGLYRAAQERGLRIPGDIAVASFNDIPAAQFLAPPLTTMRIPADRIGENAFDLLAEQMAGRDYHKKVTISTELIWRDSCRRPG